MSILGLERERNPYQNGILTTTSEGKRKNTTAFLTSVERTAASGKNKIYLDQNALFSIAHAQTGETANVYRAEGYSKENPVYLVKGTDQNGREYEQLISANEIHPNNCSYTELLVFSVHAGHHSPSDFLTMAVLKDKAESASYQDKADYLSKAYEAMQEQQTAGSWAGYLRYSRWIEDILKVMEKD